MNKNKINKIINNNKEILNVKYKERNDLLENNYDTKNDKINELEKIDKCIEDIESENKKLENELEEFKKDYDLNVNSKKDKTQLCKYYKSLKGCDKGNNCSFAHGENELKKVIKQCISGLKCYKKECEYYHPEGWDYKSNKKICKYYNENGYCINENNCKFEHIEKNNKVIDNIEESKDIFDNCNEISKFKSINNYNQKIEDKKLNIDNNSDDTIKLINDLQENIDKYIREIKKNIDETFVNDKQKYGINLKLDINKISSEILLFKNNFEIIRFDN
jgi:hypothetical protein